MFGNRRGIALIVVLWVATLLAVLGASFTKTSRTDIQLARNLVENAEAEALADAGVSYAVLGLLERDPEKQWLADGTVYEVALGDGRMAVSVQDEGGKVDLNSAPVALLKELFVSFDLAEDTAQALADAIADFRDTDDLVRASGAEDRDYRAAGLAHGAKDGRFESVEELQQVLGVTPELYWLAMPLVTVYSGRAGVDPSVAPPGVLLALPGYDQTSVDELMLGRDKTVERGTGRAATPRPARGQRGFIARSRRTAFSVRAEARTAEGGLFVREAVISLTKIPGTPYRVHTWKRGRRPVPVVPAENPDLDRETR